MTDNMIVVSDLKKSFKINRVLRNVTFTVRKGSIFALPVSYTHLRAHET